MKVYIGPYPEWVGPYEIASMFPKFIRPYIEECQWLDKLCNYIYKKRERAVVVKIDDYDVWNLDETLSHILVPILKKYKKESMGFAEVEDSELPSDIEPKSEEAWAWALDEMIFAFESCLVSPAKLFMFKDGHIIDAKAWDEWKARQRRGLRLFGEYYTSLWS